MLECCVCLLHQNWFTNINNSSIISFDEEIELDKLWDNNMELREKIYKLVSIQEQYNMDIIMHIKISNYCNEFMIL